jgi:multidrug resistance efflux pump
VGNEDLSQLKIDRGAGSSMVSHRKRPGFLTAIVIIAASVLAGILYFRNGNTVEVESATVNTAYPSQSFTLLNATGYVVAQRKAAVASKATGRVEWLGVTEGSRVKAGEVIARLGKRGCQRDHGTGIGKCQGGRCQFAAGPGRADRSPGSL